MAVLVSRAQGERQRHWQRSGGAALWLGSARGGRLPRPSRRNGGRACALQATAPPVWPAAVAAALAGLAVVASTTRYQQQSKKARVRTGAERGPGVVARAPPPPACCGCGGGCWLRRRVEKWLVARCLRGKTRCRNFKFQDLRQGQEWCVRLARQGLGLRVMERGWGEAVGAPSSRTFAGGAEGVVLACAVVCLLPGRVRFERQEQRAGLGSARARQAPSRGACGRPAPARAVRAAPALCVRAREGAGSTCAASTSCGSWGGSSPSTSVRGGWGVGGASHRWRG